MLMATGHNLDRPTNNQICLVAGHRLVIPSRADRRGISSGNPSPERDANQSVASWRLMLPGSPSPSARLGMTAESAVAWQRVRREFANSHGDRPMPWKILIASFALAGSLLAQTSPNASTAGAKRPFTFEDMMKLKRVGAPVPSPDGKWVVFDAVDVDLEANTKISHLWIVPAAGGEARRLNQTPNHEERPRFSPDGKRLIWISKATDPTQIWMSNFTPESGGSGRNTASGHEHLDRRRRCDLVARRKEHRLRLLRLSRREGRRGEQAAG